ncbi:MAG: type I-E CRISPR-associated protein Cas7/Cse4/CasC [Rhodospirillaceae bacterium]|nr:type I-E CRISPR-associated protein Cas7/Cse4/CasC [Rhodospirillaceae bacterium]
MADRPMAAIGRADVIQFHTLTHFPPHNVNRDEDGRPKTCRLGEAVRGRISSQAKKRALRFAPHFPGGQRAIRTREAGLLCFRRLLDAGIDTVSAAWAALAVNMAAGGGTGAPKRSDAERLAAPDPAKPSSQAREKAIAALMGRYEIDRPTAELRWLERELGTEQALIISTRELSRIDDGVAMLIAARRDDPEGFPAILDHWVKTICRDKLLVRADHDLDTALFGRMVAADPGFNVEAACAVSHAFTTHAFVTEGDYFSAGEELNVLQGTGAAITSYAFFGGGVYYQHAVLDRGHLRDTLSAGRSADDAERLTQEAVVVFLDGLVYAQPKGKRCSFASDVAASFLLTSRGSDPALNLGLAYLRPVTADDGPDLMLSSIGRLRETHRTVVAAYGLTNRVCIFNGYGPARTGNAPTPPEVWTVEELRRFVQEPAA